VGEGMMEQGQYGEKYHEHFLEQYKLYVQMADNVSARRSQTNQFYVSLLSVLLGVITLGSTFLGDKTAPAPDQTQKVAYLAISVLALFLCFIWYLNIRSYRQLNSGKYKIVQKMEQQMPFECYNEEWDVVGNGKNIWEYLPLTHVEQVVPVLVGLPFVILVIYFTVQLRG
jgi:hypothetical protein